MGTTYTPGWSKKQTIEDCDKPFTTTEGWRVCTVKTKTSGSEHWRLVQATNPETGEVVKYIVLDLIRKYGGDWGVKTMDESSYPYYYNVPTSWFKEVSLEALHAAGRLSDRGLESARRWRQAVLFAQATKVQPGQYRVIRSGDKAWDGKIMKIISTRPQQAVVVDNSLRIRYHRGNVGAWVSPVNMKQQEVV